LEADGCDVAERLAKYGRTDTGIKINCLKNPCQTGSDPIVDLDECLKYKHCYVSPEKQCLTKADPKVKKPNEENLVDDLKKLLFDTNETDNNVNGVDSRFFNQASTNPFGNQGLGLNFMSQNCNPFPIGCNLDPKNPISVLDAITPPVDIPYCQRIACNPSQPVFELDRTACLKNPGCYYDDELATLRSFLGEQILPGVPACQLVVRNPNFHEAVKKEQMMDGSSFNGIYTKCWLKKNDLKVNEGCHVTSALEFFKYPSQKAGWEGITARECNILGYCPTENGCVVAGNVKSITTRSAALEKSIESLNERYGQPLCQQYEFDLNDPEGYLNSYSMCMMSGCAVTSEINSNSLQQALYNIVVASSLSMLQKYQAINKIIAGEMQPHNYKDIIAALQNSCDNSNLSQMGGNDLSSLITGVINYQSLNNQNSIAPYSYDLSNNDGRINSAPNEDTSAEASQGKQFNIMNLFNEIQNPSGNANQNPFGNANQNPFGNTNQNLFGNVNPNPFGNNAQGLDLSILGNQNGFNNILGVNQGGFGLNSILGAGANGFGQNIFPNLNNFGCPYSSPSFGNYPGLKGKFTGCCKRHQCFYPRSALHKQHSGVASYYGSWTTWSKCSVTCGGGRQERKRECVSINNQPCEIISGADSVEEKICNDQQCPQITNWGAWSLCSVTCGLGVQERYRSCVPVGSCPNERLSEQQECAAASECPVFDNWGAYSQCDSDCGPGTKTRERSCLENCDFVSSADLRQSVSCYTINGEIKQINIGTCDLFKTKCVQKVNNSCLKSDGTPGCCGEDHEDGEERVKCTSYPWCRVYCTNNSFKYTYCDEMWH